LPDLPSRRAQRVEDGPPRRARVERSVEGEAQVRCPGAVWIGWRKCHGTDADGGTQTGIPPADAAVGGAEELVDGAGEDDGWIVRLHGDLPDTRTAWTYLRPHLWTCLDRLGPWTLFRQR